MYAYAHQAQLAYTQKFIWILYYNIPDRVVFGNYIDGFKQSNLHFKNICTKYAGELYVHIHTPHY